MKRIRVLVADDHAPMRAGVRAALEDGGLEVCAEAADADRAVREALAQRPDVCVLDVRMPGGGIAAARRIKEALPETEIVMLTVSRDDNDLFDALRAGASGYLLKDTDPARLPLAIQGLLAGEAALPRELAALLIEEFRRRDGRRRVRRGAGAELTPREWDVLELLRGGLGTAAIADRLGIASVTVRTHVSAILRKLRVADRAAAVSLLDER